MKLEMIYKNPFTVYFRPGTADESVLKESFENDIFFSGTPEYRPGPTDIIIDVGAHIGTFALLAASKANNGLVIAIEPSRETYFVLNQNVQANKSKKIRPLELALAGNRGKANLYHDLETGNWGHTITKALSTEFEVVPTISLQQLLEEQVIDHCNFIKFNCEGAEFDILLNTPPEILKKIDAMVVLYHDYLVESANHRHLIKHLAAAGFRIHLRNQYNEPPSGWIIAYQAGTWKNVAIEFRRLPLDARLWSKKIFNKIRHRLFSYLGKHT